MKFLSVIETGKVNLFTIWDNEQSDYYVIEIFIFS